jgi:GntR family transcriptional regulator
VIDVLPGDPRPPFRQIVDGIRRKVAAGELPPGTRLPSVRALALQLDVNPNTVAKAYAELTSEGLVAPHKGIGLFVTGRRHLLAPEERERRLGEAIRQLVSAVLPLGVPADEVVERVRRELAPLCAAHHDRSEGDE